MNSSASFLLPRFTLVVAAGPLRPLPLLGNSYSYEPGLKSESESSSKNSGLASLRCFQKGGSYLKGPVLIAVFLRASFRIGKVEKSNKNDPTVIIHRCALSTRFI